MRSIAESCRAHGAKTYPDMIMDRDGGLQDPGELGVLSVDAPGANSKQ